MNNDHDVREVRSLKTELQAEKEKYYTTLKSRDVEFWELKVIKKKIQSLRTSLSEVMQRIIKGNL